jgi:hypothetical protein
VVDEIPEIEPIETSARTLALDWGDDPAIEEESEDRTRSSREAASFDFSDKPQEAKRKSAP